MSTLTKTEAGDAWLMKGTNGGYDYIVFARNGDFAVGIRPLFAISDAACGFAFRVRAMYAPLPTESAGEDVTEVNFKAPKVGPEMAQAILESFPGFTFQRVDPKRASLIGEFPSMQCGVYQIDKIAEWFEEKDLPSRIIETLKKSLGDIELTDRAVVKTYLRDFYTTAFEQIKQKMNPEPQPEAMPDNPVVSIEDWKSKHQDDALDAQTEDESPEPEAG